MTSEKLIFGADALPRDVYIHLLDVQDFVCASWQMGKYLRWHDVMQTLSAGRLMLLLSLNDADHPAIVDFDFLILLAAERERMANQIRPVAAA